MEILDDAPIFWVPIADRQNITNAVTEVFKKDGMEKVQRIGKMLNVWLSEKILTLKNNFRALLSFPRLGK